MSTLDKAVPNQAALPPRTPAVRGYLRNAMRAVWMYRGDLAIAMVSQIIQVILLLVVWRAVFGDNASVKGITRSQAVNYAVLASCLQTMLMPWNFYSLTDRIRGGQIGIDMTRPLGLITQCLAQNVGTMLARLPITVVGLVTAAAIGAFTLPPHGPMAAVFALSLLLGVALVMLMNLGMSFASFWSLDIGGYMMLYRLGSGLASGALIPLWFMPDWLAGVLQWLPFQAQIFAPLSIYFGQVSGAGLWRTVGLQAFWLVLVAVVLRLVWRRAVHRVVVFGG